MGAIRIHGLSKTFRGTRALAGVDLTVDEGEMVALIGASGSGKSTLIRHIAGLNWRTVCSARRMRSAKARRTRW